MDAGKVDISFRNSLEMFTRSIFSMILTISIKTDVVMFVVNISKMSIKNI